MYFYYDIGQSRPFRQCQERIAIQTTNRNTETIIFIHIIILCSDWTNSTCRRGDQPSITKKKIYRMTYVNITDMWQVILTRVIPYILFFLRWRSSEDNLVKAPVNRRSPSRDYIYKIMDVKNNFTLQFQY